MMTQAKWATPPQQRDQLTLFSPSLEDSIPSDHRIRRFEEILDQVDWTSWEQEYHGNRGQPPIHPRYIAGAILFGLTERIRSSRELEKATKLRLDFMWFLHNRSIDHSTFSNFRTRFKTQLHDLFRQLAFIALKGKLEVILAVDGTRIRSNSSRTGSLRTESLANKAEQIANELSVALRRMELFDAQEATESETLEELEQQIAVLSKQRDQLSKALEEAQRRDEVRLKHNGSKNSRSGRMPLSDPDSYYAPNKEGGFAPNYTPTAAIEISEGIIVMADVPPGQEEANAIHQVIEETENFIGKPASMLFDSGFATGTNLKELSDLGIESYSSVPNSNRANSALRADLTAPVPEEHWADLPAQKKDGSTLTKEAFVYDEKNDCYWCPMGKKIAKIREGNRTCRGKTVFVKEFRSSQSDCEKCPLAGRCLLKNAKTRGINRDEFEDYRDSLCERMKDEDALELYSQRAPAIEGVFAHIKHNMGIRQFLHRGMEKVRSEWLWICSAFNITKMLNKIMKSNDPETQINQMVDLDDGLNHKNGCKNRILTLRAWLYTFHRAFSLKSTFLLKTTN